MSADPEIEEGILAFELGLSEGGDEGSDFRTQNDPSAPLQRSNITERKGAIDIRCTGADVIHGYLKDGEGPATLIIYEFQFDPRKKARRIATVDIEFVFGSNDGAEPEVLKISPKGRMTLVPTTQTETITKGGSANAGGNAFGAELGGSWQWEKAISRETKNATTIVGSIDLKGRNFGASNAASWTLLENEAVKTGVPAHFRTAVLLSRKDDEEFYSTFKIRAQVDLVSRFTRLFGSTPKDDPILYDPTLPPTNKLREYDVGSLGDIDLQELSVVSFTNNGN
ncbi:hypothetical protein GGS26DRAFT_548721 [Hypomontagnella submonticulosa]|nr:hypothetical protein GGS26DRAFT_548721 [Hypomontagnella submonticulosa]